MPHSETIRLVPSARTAVLMIHGIAGTPNHFRTILPLEHLVPENWSLYNILIDGHGKQVEDFSRSSMQKWKTHVMGVFEQLCRTHDRVFLVGHSMGTLFSIEMARRRPEKVAGLFLIAVPLRVGIRLFGVCNLVKLPFGKLDLADPVQESVSRVCSIEPTKKIWKYLGWLPRVFELIRLMHQTVYVLPELSVPAVAYQSHTDELVSRRSGKLLTRSGKVEVHTLEKSTHFYYHPEDISRVQQCFTQFLS